MKHIKISIQLLRATDEIIDCEFIVSTYDGKENLKSIRRQLPYTPFISHYDLMVKDIMRELGDYMKKSEV